MSTSTKSEIESVEKADNQASPVAISEENLAALLRATASSSEPEVQPLSEEDEAAAPVTTADDISAAKPPKTASFPELSQSPPAEAVESRLALFAAVKEHRSAILRSEVKPEAPPVDLPPAGKVDTTQELPEQCEPVSLPLKVVPIEVTLPKPKPFMPAPTASTAVGGEQSRNSSRTRLVIGIIILALVVVGVSTYLIRTHTSKAPKVTASAPVDNIPLQVQVEQLGNGLMNVRWDPQSASIAHAREGRLVVTERGQQPKTIPLTPGQLTTGNISYQSSAEWLQFQLEVVDNSGSVAKDAIVTSSSKPPPAVTNVAPPQVTNLQSPSGKVESMPVPRTDADALRLAKPTEAPPSRPPEPRAFTPPPTSGRRAAEVPAISLDQLPVVTGATPLPLTLSPPTTLTNLPPPVVKEPPVTQPVRVGGSIQAPSLIKKVPPHYPQIALSSHIEGAVRFTALIGKDGTVRSLQVISGNQMFIQAATDAVKQWIYRPTLLHGDPVEVITQIDVNFTLK